MKRNMLASLSLAAVLFAIPALSHAQVTINLRTGAISGSSPGVMPTVTYQGANANCSTGGVWYNGFVKVDLSPGTRTAFFTVEYEGTPWGWTADIGDSPTDDGYGGSRDSYNAAEVQVVGQALAVYDFDRGIGVQNLLNQPQLSLTNGSLKFGVANQILAVGQPRTVLATPVTKTLFTLPDPSGDGSNVYAGFNHVIDPTSGRIGCGARFVTIWTGTTPPGV